MDAMQAVALAAAVVLLGGLGWVLMRRRTGVRRPDPNAQAKAWRQASFARALELVPGPDSCEAVRRLAGTEMSLNDPPTLPLPDCDRARQCACRFKPLVQRRKGGDRRKATDRRAEVRVEKKVADRRSHDERRNKPWGREGD